MTIAHMLEQRHKLKLRWFNTVAACGPNGALVPVSVEYRATVDDCISMNRHRAKSKGQPPVDDEHNLIVFMAMHHTVMTVLEETITTSRHEVFHPMDSIRASKLP